MQVDATQSAKGLSCMNEEQEFWESELGVSQSPPSGLPPRVGLCYCACNSEETAVNTLSCCYMQAALLIKLEPDLKGNGKETSTLVIADILELPYSGCN